MSTTLKIENINQLLQENRDIVQVTRSPTCVYLLYLIRSRPGITLNQIKSEFTFKSGTAEDWLKRILDVGLIESKNSEYFMTLLGERKLALTDVSLKELGGIEITGTQDVLNRLPDSYKLDSIPLGIGATSVTFRAIQESTGLPRTVKIFRIGLITYEQLKDFKEKRAKIPKEVAIPDFIGMGQFSVEMKDHVEPIVLSCQVFEYVNHDAKTLQEYINADPEPYLSRDFFRFFVEHVGGALEAIERVGLRHGDLHARNILVVRREKREPSISFKVIDLAGGSSFNSLSFSGVTDLEMFKRHLIWCLSEVSHRRPGVSARELVGSNVERVIFGLREEKYRNFAELLDDFHRPSNPTPPEYFKEPPSRPFEWLRVEMMPSLKKLYMLFEPDQYVLEAISASDNVIISGPRGCGKSHYLRILNFWPQLLKIANNSEELKVKLERIKYDYRRFFGILFECRVGEFKNFTPEAMDAKTFSAETVRVLKHILVLKIINKTLSALREGCESEILLTPQNILALRNFIQERFPNIPLYGEPNALEEMVQFSRALVTKEKQAESTWNLPDHRERDTLLAEPDVEAFFESLQKDFPDLTLTQFFILVDDISEGRMHLEMQKVLNSIMTSSTKRFCFKVTCDKFMYTLDTAEGRSIDPFQDVVYIDLGDLSVKAQKTRKAISEYIGGIVNARLNAWVSQKSDIVKIMGVSQEPKEFLGLLGLPRKERKEKTDIIQKDNTQGKALYAGWNIIWQLSHGSIRTLFQLLDYIFARSYFDRNNPKPIPLEIQDKYVREFSKQKFQSLLMLKGHINGEPVGTLISNVARSIGEVSRLYLRRWKTGEPGRFYETISMERLDLEVLDEKAIQVLKYLIVYDVLIIAGITFSRAQIGLSERYDLNKIYAPGFQITYRVRNHLYLSKFKFEELLLEPGKFVRNTRSRLDDLVVSKQNVEPKNLIQMKLFDED